MQRLRKISAILLSCLVLLSSTSFTFDMHFCMGQLRSIALSGGANPCEMAEQKTPCSNKQHDSDREHKITKKSCCEDLIIVLEGSDELSLVKSISIPDFRITAMPYALVSFIFTASSVDYFSSNDYPPPLIERDIPVLVQSFLI